MGQPRLRLVRNGIEPCWRVDEGEYSPEGYPPSSSPTQQGGEVRSSPILLRFMGFLVMSAVLLSLLFMAASTALQSYRVEGISMEPGLSGGDQLIVNKLSYGRVRFDLLSWLPAGDRVSPSIRLPWGSPGRGDVVVFEAPGGGEDLVKRIVGLPGETVQIDGSAGLVKIDGQALDEPYARGPTKCRWICEWTVPPYSYFVLGDNRETSIDSRQGWFVRDADIVGTPIMSY